MILNAPEQLDSGAFGDPTGALTFFEKRNIPKNAGPEQFKPPPNGDPSNPEELQPHLPTEISPKFTELGKWAPEQSRAIDWDSDLSKNVAPEQFGRKIGDPENTASAGTQPAIPSPPKFVRSGISSFPKRHVLGMRSFETPGTLQTLGSTLACVKLGCFG